MNVRMDQRGTEGWAEPLPGPGEPSSGSCSSRSRQEDEAGWGGAGRRQIGPSAQMGTPGRWVGEKLTHRALTLVPISSVPLKQPPKLSGL